ncbi:protein of unknown function [Aminobacter niigataensis]|nr:protein of unknown function [Aminobacter niigataensis]
MQAVWQSFCCRAADMSAVHPLQDVIGMVPSPGAAQPSHPDSGGGYVVDDRKLGKEPSGLKRPHNAAARELLRRMTGEVQAAEKNSSSSWPLETGHDVYRGGFASAVRTYETGDRSGPQLQRDIINGDESCKSHIDMFKRQGLTIVNRRNLVRTLKHVPTLPNGLGFLLPGKAWRLTKGRTGRCQEWAMWEGRLPIPSHHHL